MSNLHAPRQNRLLAALPASLYARLAPHLEPVKLPLCDVLYESGDELHDVYFPTTAIVSLLDVTEAGTPAEIAGIGNEGVIGVAFVMGGRAMPDLIMVQRAGYAYRLKPQLLKDEFNRAGALQGLLLRYTQALMAQIAQTAVCNRHHPLEQRLCRWLLLNLDRLPSGELMMQELIAGALGVRCECLAEAAEKLQCAGFIDCRHGHITVLDRPGLENWTCACYRVVKTEFDDLFPDVAATPIVAPDGMWSFLAASRKIRNSAASPRFADAVN